MSFVNVTVFSFVLWNEIKEINNENRLIPESGGRKRGFDNAAA